MIGVSALKYFVTDVAKPFIFIGRIVRHMCAAVKARVVRRDHWDGKNLICFTNDADIEAASEKWESPRFSYPGMTSDISGIEKVFVDVPGELEGKLQSPRQKHRDNPPFPQPLEQERAESTTQDYFPTQRHPQRRHIDPSTEMLETPIRSIRVSHARVKRRLILFGDDEKSGHIQSVAVPLDVSLNAANIFAPFGSAQGRILRARAIRHKVLFNVDVDIEFVNSDLDPSFGPVSPHGTTNVPIEAGVNMRSEMLLVA